MSPSDNLGSWGYGRNLYTDIYSISYSCHPISTHLGTQVTRGVPAQRASALTVLVHSRSADWPCRRQQGLSTRQRIPSLPAVRSQTEYR